MYKALLVLYINLAFSIVPVKTYKLNFYTSYNQFYIGDKDYSGDTGAADFWSDASFADRLATGNDVLGVGTGSYGRIRVEVCVLDKPNANLDFKRYDHVVEGNLKIRSGFMEITNCPDNEVELKVKMKPGDYRVRVYSVDLAKADTDLFEGKDSYKIEIWPDAIKPRLVLKRYRFSQ